MKTSDYETALTMAWLGGKHNESSIIWECACNRFDGMAYLLSANGEMELANECLRLAHFCRTVASECHWKEAWKAA